MPALINAVLRPVRDIIALPYEINKKKSALYIPYEVTVLSMGYVFSGLTSSVGGPLIQAITSTVLPTIHNTAVQSVKYIFGGVAFGHMGEQWIKAIFRTILAAAAVFAVISAAPSLPITLALGAATSLPTTLIAAGSYASYMGITMTITALSTGSFATLGIGLGSIAGGWLALEYHDFSKLIQSENGLRSIGLGLVEYAVITPFAEKYSDKVIKIFSSK